MLIDAPGVEDIDKKKGDRQIKLTQDNAQEVLNMINKFNR